MSNHIGRGIGYVAVALVAGGLGMLIGTLTASASGEETRRRWRRRAEDEIDTIRRRGQRALEDAVQQGKDYAEAKLDRSKEAVTRLVRD